MAVVLLFEWEGFTPRDYDDLRERLGWDANPPDGNLFHAAWFEDEGIHVVDVWESEQHFHRFLQQELMPVLTTEIKPRGKPKFEFRPLHAKNNAEVARLTG